MSRCLYIAAGLLETGTVEDQSLAATSERHRVAFERPVTVAANLEQTLAADPGCGVLLELDHGWPGRAHLKLARRLLAQSRRVWFHWPAEQAVEVVDDERLGSYWRLWLMVKGYGLARRIVRGRRLPTAPSVAAASTAPPIHTHKTRVEALIAQAAPVGWAGAGTSRRAGAGVYLRLGYWERLTSGGSYGHTCFVARELAAASDGLVCLLGQRFDLLDELGVRQVALDAPSTAQNEIDLISATPFYYPTLRVALEALAPRYIYERIVLGNYVGAQLSQELAIPYIVEYNGSEISMRRSFEGSGFAYEDLYRRMELAAFSQATLITVVSEVIKDDLVQRGINPERILINPNGADLHHYQPADAVRRAEIRGEFGWGADEVVVGFSGTFGGWHGIDVLAAALPRICAKDPRIHFLLIGDGPLRPQLDAVVEAHGLQDRVQRVGRVPQREGARLLGACDLYVSPHSSHMVDSKFFGSPTKLFEYMAMAGGIVASDLEQLGDVLSPSLTPDRLVTTTAVTDERALVCRPGDVDEFVAAVVGLAARPEIAAAMGRNAREAVRDEFSWAHHVDRILAAVEGVPVSSLDYRSARVAAPAPALALAGGGPEPPRIATGDPYKDQVQNQWNNNPVGSQYARKSEPRTLEWYREVEAYRYNEYAPWMHETMEFSRHRGERVLEIGGGMGTDLAQFALHGADVTDVDLSAGHLEHARENFRLRGLAGRFVHHDAEGLPFPDATFDVVYSNGVIHHTPNTRDAVAEIRRVLKPGGLAIVMVYAETSLHYWGVQVFLRGLRQGLIEHWSMGEIMSRGVELTANDARPLVKVYTRRRLRQLFAGFDDICIVQRQLTRPELVGPLRVLPADAAGRLFGWNLVLKARRPKEST